MQQKILKFIVFLTTGHLIYSLDSNIVDIYLHISEVWLSIILLWFISKSAKTELAYKSVYRISRILLTAKDCSELFKKITVSLVDDVGFKMCWIGFLEGDKLVPKYYYGSGIEYAKTIYININPETVESKGPSATSIIENRPILCPNIQKSKITDPWKARAKLYGWNSSLSIPIKQKGNIIGAIAIYSNNINGFQKIIIDVIIVVIVVIGCLVVVRYADWWFAMNVVVDVGVDDVVR